MEYSITYLILACAAGLFMAWGIGANDVANAMGTSVGSKALTIKQAIVIAAIFESAGALLAGGEVTNTIRGKIIDISVFEGATDAFILGMMAALFAAGTWLLVASYFGLPVSTTHSIVGAIMGFGIIYAGTNTINWNAVVNILLSWIITPFIAGILAYLLFRSVQILIFNSSNPYINARRYVPIYIFIVILVICLVTFIKGLSHLGINLSLFTTLSASVGLSLLCTIVGALLIHKIPVPPMADMKYDFTYIERIFGLLMIFTACAMTFAHGSNDVANAIGPLAAIVSAIYNSNLLTQPAPLPVWIMLLGAVGIVAGLAMYGYKVIATVGKKITELTPSRGFAAELSAASTIIIASGFGLPISTTHTLVGAVLGVGMARGLSALRLNVVGKIFMSWLITLPAGAILAITYFFILKLIFIS